jgi:hypothetical protein
MLSGVRCGSISGEKVIFDFLQIKARIIDPDPVASHHLFQFKAPRAGELAPFYTDSHPD